MAVSSSGSFIHESLMYTSPSHQNKQLRADSNNKSPFVLWNMPTAATHMNVNVIIKGSVNDIQGVS